MTPKERYLRLTFGFHTGPNNICMCTCRCIHLNTHTYFTSPYKKKQINPNVGTLKRTNYLEFSFKKKKNWEINRDKRRLIKSNNTLPKRTHTQDVKDITKQAEACKLGCHIGDHSSAHKSRYTAGTVASKTYFLDVVAHMFNLSTYQSEASLVYITSCRTVRNTWKEKTCLKNKAKQNSLFFFFKELHAETEIKNHDTYKLAPNIPPNTHVHRSRNETNRVKYQLLVKWGQ